MHNEPQLVNFLSQVGGIVILAAIMMLWWRRRTTWLLVAMVAEVVSMGCRAVITLVPALYMQMTGLHFVWPLASLMFGVGLLCHALVNCLLSRQRDSPGAIRMTYITKPKLHHPTLGCNAHWLYASRLRRKDFHIVRRLRTRLDFRRDHPGLLGTGYRATPCGKTFRHRLQLEDAGLFPGPVARIQHGAWAHAFGADGREPGQSSELLYLGVSGDGDSASIGIGQFVHAIRRGVNMVYIVENNGVYGLTKGQFSATADLGSKSKRGVVNTDSPLDMVGLALQLGATFVARSFSGDKQQLVPLIKAAIAHKGAAFLDVISPCVAFNNHPGSTKSYEYVREHNEAVNRLDFIDGREEITVDYAAGELIDVTQHDGTILRLRKLNASLQSAQPHHGHELCA